MIDIKKKNFGLKYIIVKLKGLKKSCIFSLIFFNHKAFKKYIKNMKVYFFLKKEGTNNTM
jgi:hypothetical protein